MRKGLSVALGIVAGFFFYVTAMLAFISKLPVGSKVTVMAVFSVPASIALLSGLSLSRFHEWKRTTGVILISAAGMAAFVALSMACLLMSKEFQPMMHSDGLSFFDDYVSGIAVIAGLALAGRALICSNRVGSEKAASDV